MQPLDERVYEGFENAGWKKIRAFFATISHTTDVYQQPRVARWFVFKPKIPIWVNFGGP
jgi:hypothetical protein